MKTVLRNILLRLLLVTAFVAGGSLVAFADNVANTPVPSPSDIESSGWTLVPPECLGERAPEECGFDQLMQLIANIMGLLMVIALSLATLLFAYAGFRYATALGNPSQIQGAKKMFTNVAIGLALVFGAYLIVQVVVSVLGVEDNYNMFLEKGSEQQGS